MYKKKKFELNIKNHYCIKCWKENWNGYHYCENIKIPILENIKDKLNE